MAKFIKASIGEYDYVIINLETIQKIEFVWNTLDDEGLTEGDEADRRFYAEKTEQDLNDVDLWIESYIITFCNEVYIKVFLIDNKLFKSEADLTDYLNNL